MTAAARGVLVEVADLQMRAGGATVLDRVGFTVGAGESVALVGASGSGKTTTALALLGHLRDGVRHTAGTVRVDGHDVLPTPPPHLRGETVGYLGQDPAATLNPYRPVASTLLAALGATPRARRAARVADLLRRVALNPDLAGRYPHQLSGGQQQRVALAVALAREPRLLLLDEPTSALDVVAAGEVRRELLARRGEGVTLLWITHDLAAVARAVDRVLVLDQGRLVEDAPYGRLLAEPAAPAAKALVAAAAQTRPGARPLRLVTPVLSARDLVARYPTGPNVLDGVSLDVLAGRCLAVLGASGVGKTTLGRCLVGLHRPAAGSVRLGETELAADVRARTQPQRAAVQLVAQDPASTLHPRHDVRTTLSRSLRLFRGLRSRGQVDAEVARLLDAVRLPPAYAGRLPGELSGGERQRVALARALAARPRVLVCDEVTAALDTVTQAAILDLLAELCATQDLGVVLITHAAHAVRYLADEVLVLAAGRVAAHGPVADVLPDDQAVEALADRLRAHDQASVATPAGSHRTT